MINSTNTIESIEYRADRLAIAYMQGHYDISKLSSFDYINEFMKVQSDFKQVLSNAKR